MTMSASLPGVREPTFASSAQSRAPWSVASSTTSRAVRSLGRSFSPLSERSLIMTRWSIKHDRIIVNMSAVIDVSTSLDRLGRTPLSSASWITGMPCRIVISIGTADDMRPDAQPVFAGGQELILVDARAEGRRQELVGRREIALLQSLEILRPL